MPELAKKKKNRGGHRGVVTKLIGRVNERITKDDFDVDGERAWVKQQVVTVKEKTETLRKLDGEIIGPDY